jgi:hypothetical protein
MRKRIVDEEMVQVLDALMNERPISMQMKRKHLHVNDGETSHFD